MEKEKERDRAVIFFDFRWISKRTEHSRKFFTSLFQRKFQSRCTNSLENESNPALFGICISDCKRNALTKVQINLNDNKLSCLAVACNFRSSNLHIKYTGRKLFFFNNFKHLQSS